MSSCSGAVDFNKNRIFCFTLSDSNFIKFFTFLFIIRVVYILKICLPFSVLNVCIMLIYPLGPFFLYFGKLVFFCERVLDNTDLHDVSPSDESFYNSIHPHKHIRMTSCELWSAMSRGHSNRTCHLGFFRSSSAPSAILCVIQPLRTHLWCCSEGVTCDYMNGGAWFPGNVICKRVVWCFFFFKLDLVIES